MSTSREDVDLVDHEEPPAVLPVSQLNGHASPTEVNLQYTPRESSTDTDSGIGIRSENNNLTNATVCYTTGTAAKVVQQPGIVRSLDDGGRVIITSELPQEIQERPLKEKDLRFLVIFATIAVVLFFPTGIAAMYYAFKTKKEFHAGIERGDLTVAKKKCKICERLIILSLVAGLFLFVVVFAVIEKETTAHHHYHHGPYGPLGIGH